MGRKRGDGNSIGLLVPEGMLTRAQLADRLGVSYDTIVRWERAGRVSPTAYMKAGKTRIPLYTKQTVVLDEG